MDRETRARELEKARVEMEDAFEAYDREHLKLRNWPPMQAADKNWLDRVDALKAAFDEKDRRWRELLATPID